jgi:hypothetical protein
MRSGLVLWLSRVYMIVNSIRGILSVIRRRWTGLQLGQARPCNEDWISVVVGELFHMPQ